MLSPGIWRPESQRSLMSEECPSSRREEIHSSFAFLSYLGLWWIDWVMPAHPIDLYLSTDSNQNDNLFQKHLQDTSRSNVSSAIYPVKKTDRWIPNRTMQAKRQSAQLKEKRNQTTLPIKIVLQKLKDQLKKMGKLE